MEKLSLLKYCQKCGATCCKASSTIGAPIISEEEATQIRKLFGGKVLKLIKSPSGEVYYLPNDTDNVCTFLKNNQCILHEHGCKPLDCQCYPIKAIYKEDKIIYITDTDCPAFPRLTEDFIELAKIVALKSIKRFKPETYKHWLESYIGWVKNI